MSHRYVIIRAYECPDCKGVFEVRHTASDTTPPAVCHLCRADMLKKKRKIKLKEVASPRARYPKGLGVASRSGDAVYRQMENASLQKMEDAAQILGVDPSSLNNMKMTNMRDNLREGDTTLVESSVPAAAVRLAGSYGGSVENQPASFQNQAAGIEYAKSTGSGPVPFAGNAMRELITSFHSGRAQQTVAAGRMNRR